MSSVYQEHGDVELRKLQLIEKNVDDMSNVVISAKGKENKLYEIKIFPRIVNFGGTIESPVMIPLRLSRLGDVVDCEELDVVYNSESSDNGDSALTAFLKIVNSVGTIKFVNGEKRYISSLKIYPHPE